MRQTEREKQLDELIERIEEKCRWERVGACEWIYHGRSGDYFVTYYFSVA